MILRNVTITIAEIEITENAGPVSPAATETAPATEASAAGGAQAPNRSDNGGSHVDHQDGSPVEISAAAPERLACPVAGGVTDDCGSPAAGEKAVTPAGGDNDAGPVTVEAGAAPIVAPPTVLDEVSAVKLPSVAGVPSHSVGALQQSVGQRR